MTPQQTHAGSAHRQRAALLGSLLALASAAGAAALLCWSIGELRSAQDATIPVAEGVTLLTAGVAGVVAAGLAYAAALGVLALRAGAVPDPAAQGLRLAPRLATRSATMLLALAVTAPAAHADVSHGQPTTSIASASSISSVASSAAGTEVEDINLPSHSLLAHSPPAHSPPAHSLPGQEDGDSDEGGGALGASLRTTTPPRPVPLPGWQSTRVTPPTPAPATTETSTPMATPTEPVTPMTSSTEDALVVVTRGDTLWSIAAADLGPAASPAQIAAHWPRWYEANRRVIGPNPDLILPGHVLQPPTPSGEQP